MESTYLRKERVIILSLLVVVFTSVRLMLIFFDWRLFYDYLGTLSLGLMAKKLSMGCSWIDIFNNPMYPNEGLFSVFYATFTGLFFKLFSDSYVILLLFSFAFNIALFIILYYIISKYMHRDIAIINAFFLIFCPLPYLHYTITFEAHSKPSIFEWLAVLLFLNISCNSQKRDAKGMDFKIQSTIFIMGAVLGFGSCFSYYTAIGLGAILIMWFFYYRCFLTRRTFLIFFIGCAVGISPLLIYNLANGWIGVRHFDEGSLLQLLYTRPIPVMWYVLTKRLPEQLLIWGAHSSKAMYGLMIVSLLWPIVLVLFSKIKAIKFIPSCIDSKEILIRFIFFVVYSALCVAQISIMNIAYNAGTLSTRIFHWLPAIFISLSIFIYTLYRIMDLFILNKFIWIVKGLYLVTMMIFLVYWGYGNTEGMFSRQGHKLDFVRGYSIFAESWFRKEPAEDIFIWDVQRGRVRDIRYKVMAWLLRSPEYFNIYTYDDNFTKVIGSIAQMPIIDRPYCYIMLGVYAGDCKDTRNIKDIMELAAARMPAEGQHYFFEGLAISLGYELIEKAEMLSDIAKNVPPKYHHYFWIQYGRVLGERYAWQRGWKYAVNQVDDMNIGGMEKYVHQGLIWSMLDGISKNKQMKLIDNKFAPGYYKKLGELYKDGELLNVAPHVYRRYVLEGMYKEKIYEEEMTRRTAEEDIAKRAAEENASKKTSHDGTDIKGLILNKIKEIQAEKDFSDDDKLYLYQALGREIGLYTFGHLASNINIDALLKKELNIEQFKNFYLGYSMSIRMRYGEDFELIEYLIRTQIPTHLIADCLKENRCGST